MNASKWVLLFWLPSAFASVSLLQETREIQCSFVQSHPRYDRLVMDAKDTRLTAYKNAAVVAEFERVKFLDSAVLMKSKNSMGLFQIFMNGEILFTEGEQLNLMEKDCEDTGASKTCKTEEIKKLFWSPEKLVLDSNKGRVGGPIDNYGFLANHATYFRVRDGKKALTLIDYGSALEMIFGASFALKCSYL